MGIILIFHPLLPAAGCERGSGRTGSGIFHDSEIASPISLRDRTRADGIRLDTDLDFQTVAGIVTLLVICRICGRLRLHDCDPVGPDGPGQA
jgi:hypothetical protein